MGVWKNNETRFRITGWAFARLVLARRWMRLLRLVHHTPFLAILTVAAGDLVNKIRGLHLAGLKVHPAADCSHLPSSLLARPFTRLSRISRADLVFISTA